MKNINKIVLGLLLGQSIYGASFFQAPKEYNLRYMQYIGTIDGFVQIPRGGQHGSTTIEKPEFSELGIKDINYPDFRAEVKWEDFFMNFEVEYKSFKGSDRIGYDLISHNLSFPKGTQMDTTHEYINYRFGFGYDIFETEKFRVAPTLDFIITDFAYKYSASNGINGSRQFNWVSAQVGLNMSYQVLPRYKMELNTKAAIFNLDKLRSWGSIEFLNVVTLYEYGKNQFNLLAGIGAEHMEFRDRQRDRQNHMKYNFAPIYKVGFEYKFK